MIRERRAASVLTESSVVDSDSSEKYQTNGRASQKNAGRKKIARNAPWGKMMGVVQQQAHGSFDFRKNILLVWIALGAFLLLLLQSYFSMPATTSGSDMRFASRRLLSFRPGKNTFLPKSEWPFSLKDHPEQFESITHPGDNITKLSVPQFWSLPIHKNGLMSRELAMKIGTCNEPDSRGNVVRGDDCPLDQRTIFIAIASYRDFQCRETVENVMKRASNPARIRIGVVDQIVDGIDVACYMPMEPCEKNPEQSLCKYKQQIDVLELDATLSLGPTFARNLGYRMYRGEYYIMQTDAHITFVQDWDRDIIMQMESTKNEMAVLTAYLSDIKGSVDKHGHSLRDTRPIMCNSDFEESSGVMYIRHETQPEAEPNIPMPLLETWWAAGFSFSRGHFAVNVPYDPYQTMVFQGEEMSVTVRAFTIGYDMYAPERSVCFHHYNREDKRIKYFDENENKYPDDIARKGMRRVVGITRMAPEIDPNLWNHREEDIYGLGGVRTPEKFYKTFGIDVINKVVQKHMCTWVDGKGTYSMHNQFTPFLRSDGMGIDYSKINFAFKDPLPNQKDDDEAEEEKSKDEEDGEESDEEKSKDEEEGEESDEEKSKEEGGDEAEGESDKEEGGGDEEKEESEGNND